MTDTQEEAPTKPYRTISRDEYLATVPHGWVVWDRDKICGEKWWNECRTMIHRIVGDAEPDAPFLSMEDARQAAVVKDGERLRSRVAAFRHITHPTGVINRLVSLVWRAISKARRDHVALALQVEKAVDNRLADYAAGKCEVAIHDLKARLRVAGSLPKGTKLWVVSLHDPFGKGPVLASAEVVGVSEDLTIYEGDWQIPDRPEIDYLHEIVIRGDTGGWRGPEGCSERRDLKLVDGNALEELPWNIHGERLFYSKEAAERCLLDQAEKCRRAVHIVPKLSK